MIPAIGNRSLKSILPSSYPNTEDRHYLQNKLNVELKQPISGEALLHYIQSGIFRANQLID